MAINIDELMAKLGDDAPIPLGEDGSIKGADLKQYLTSTRGEIENRDKTLAQLQAENARLKKYEADTAVLFRTAAEQAALETQNPPVDPRLRQQPLSDEDQEYAQLTSDPLYKPMVSKVLPRYLQEREEKLLGKLTPEFQKIQQQNQQLTNALLSMQIEKQYRDAGEWPEGFDLKKVIETGRERRYFIPGGEQFGLVDVNRVHNEVMTPIQRQKEIEKARQEGAEQALLQMRQNPNVVMMPNRDGVGGKKLVAKGRTPDEILSNSMAEAANDLATIRSISGMKG